MGLGQESGREGEVVSLEAASSAPGRVAMKCQEAPFAASAQKIGRGWRPVAGWWAEGSHKRRGDAQEAVATKWYARRSLRLAPSTTAALDPAASIGTMAV